MEAARGNVLGAYEGKELGPTATEKECTEWGAATDVSLEGRVQHGGAVHEEALHSFGPLAIRAGTRPICLLSHDWTNPCALK